MKPRVMRTVSTCFFVLRQLRCIRRSMQRPVLQSLVVSLIVLSRLDYGNATLVGISYRPLRRLQQSVINSAARLIYPSSRFSHITPLLQLLDRLKSEERINFKVVVLVFKCRHLTLPMSYFARRACKVKVVFVLRRYHAQLVVRWTCRSTVGDQSFMVAGPRLFNNLPQHVTSASSQIELESICRVGWLDAIDL